MLSGASSLELEEVGSGETFGTHLSSQKAGGTTGEASSPVIQNTPQSTFLIPAPGLLGARERPSSKPKSIQGYYRGSSRRMPSTPSK